MCTIVSFIVSCQIKMRFAQRVGKKKNKCLCFLTNNTYGVCCFFFRHSKSNRLFWSSVSEPFGPEGSPRNRMSFDHFYDSARAEIPTVVAGQRNDVSIPSLITNTLIFVWNVCPGKRVLTFFFFFFFLDFFLYIPMQIWIFYVILTWNHSHNTNICSEIRKAKKRYLGIVV